MLMMGNKKAANNCAPLKQSSLEDLASSSGVTGKRRFVKKTENNINSSS